MGNEEQNHQRHGAHGGAENTPDDGAPSAAGHVADHHDRHGAERNAEPVHVGDEVAAEEFCRVGERNVERDERCYAADKEGALADGFDDGRGREIEIGRIRDSGCGAHSDSPFPDFVGIISGRVAPVPGSRNSGVFDGMACPCGTLAREAFWLSCSARM